MTMRGEQETARARLLFGTDEVVEPSRVLVAGPLSAELDRGALRYIRWHGFEVLRGIAFVVRDTRWGTYVPDITALDIDEAANGFSVAYEASVDGPDGRFDYKVTIEGRADGRLRFAAQGRTSTGFTTNRTGFVVLHGLEGVAGRPLEVHHTDSTVTRTSFPSLVQPDQPASDIARLRHELAPGLVVDVRFGGDVFEMEDQRNWTDASFKTYVRPLSRGYPYRIEAQEELVQEVEVRIIGATPSRAGTSDEPVRVSWGDEDDGEVPRIGLYLDQAGLAAAEARTAAIAALRPGYLQARVDVRDQAAMGCLDHFLALARAWNCPLHLDAVIAGLEPHEELRTLAEWAARAGPLPDALFVVPARDLRSRPSGEPSGEAGAAAILAAARALLPGVRLVGGMPVGFAELNRNRPPPGIDMVAHATYAIVHAADDRSVMETLESLPHVVATTRSFAGAVPYRMGPATIGLPPSAAASPPIADASGRRLAIGSCDPRQRGLFAAAFMIGYVAAARDIAALTLGAAAGEIGLLEDSGRMRPAAMSFAGLAALGGRPRLRATSPAPHRLAAVAAKGEHGPVLWLANLSARPITVELDGRAGGRILTIDAERLEHGPADRIEAEPLTSSTIRLASFAICRIASDQD